MTFRKFKALYRFQQVVILGVPDRARAHGGLVSVLQPHHGAVDLPRKLPTGNRFPHLLP